MPDRKLKTLLHEMNQRQWLNVVNSSSKCDSFKQFKIRVKFENYHIDVTNKKHRVAISKLRTSDHKLMIEQGEENKAKNRSFRTCPRCKCCIENECHFLVSCAIYNSRDIVCQKIEEKYPSLVELDIENKFILLLSQEDKDKSTKYWQLASINGS